VNWTPPGLATGRTAHIGKSQRRGKKMNTGNKDELVGTAHEVKGAVKEAAGKVLGNAQLEAEGHVEKVAGKIQHKVGEIKKVLEK
jgi:uncharacterized protein YjbJ (UPF0337 family)